MNEQRAVSQEQAAGGRTADVLAALEQLSDEELAGIIVRAQGILEGREREERDKALEEIQTIARAHGLKVNVQDLKRKRGRPRKKADTGAGKRDRQE